MRVLHLCIREFYLTIERTRQKTAADDKMVIHFPEEPGFVVTQSSSAHAAGIRSRMPLEKAREILPDGIFIPADFQLYASVSDQINSRIRDLYPFTEQLDFYEWFTDLSGEEEGEKFKNVLQSRICHRYPFQLTFSLSKNKFLAKLGNDTGRTFETGPVREMLGDTSVDYFWGIPRKWVGEFKQMGIASIGEIGGLDPELLEKQFPNAGRRLVQLGRGEDDNDVQPFSKPSRLTRSAVMKLSDGEDAQKDFISGLAEELSAQLVKSGHTAFALRLEIVGCGQTVSHRYRFLLPTVRSSSILVGATSMLKKVRELLPAEGTIQLNLSVDDIVYNRDVYQMHGSPYADLEVMSE